MASNNEWEPLTQRQKKDRKQKDARAKILEQLGDMFGSNFEIDIISTIAEHSNWNLDRAIDTLITLSSDQQPTDSDQNVSDAWLADEFQDRDSSDTSPETTDVDAWNMEEKRETGEDKEVNEALNENDDHELELAGRKVETASLCGLKVQYRPRGMENNSDDDADVVIEDEASDYRVETPEPDQVSVCHFLSTPTQCPPRVTFPKLDCITTSSPPQSPFRQPTYNPQDKTSLTLSSIESDIQKGYKILVLMRGVPGSGKSFLARSIVTTSSNGDFATHIFSSDDYFAEANGGFYIFDPSKLQDAHRYNQNRVRKALRDSVSPIIVDNTNTQAWEMKEYAMMAVSYGYIVETLEPNTPWSHNVNELELRNVHGVPKANIRRMLSRYEPDITGDKLLRMFSMRYAANNQPPQMRAIPPINAGVHRFQRKYEGEDRSNAELQMQRRAEMQDDELNQQTNRLCNMLTDLAMTNPANPRQRNAESTANNDGSVNPPILKRRDNPWSAIEDQPTKNNMITERKTENNTISTIAREYSNFEEFMKDTNKKSNTGKEANDSWIAGSFYKEDNQFEKTKLRLGAIGSERKYVANNFYGEDDEDAVADESRENSSPCSIKAIGFERKNSAHTLDEKQPEAEEAAASAQTWELTTPADSARYLELRADVPVIAAIEQQLESNAVGADTSVLSEASTPSDSASNNSSDFEKVEMPNVLNLSNASAEQLEQPATEEKSTLPGLGYFFDFLKSSFYSSENQNVKPQENLETREIDNLTENLLNKHSELEKNKCYELPSPKSLVSENDTLSSKLSHLKVNNARDLNVDLSEENVIVVKVNDSMKISNESAKENKRPRDVSFEAPDGYEECLLQENNVSNVIKQLREACSDLILGESSTQTEETMRNRDVRMGDQASGEEDMLIDDITFEKEFIDQLLNKNLNEHTLSDDEDTKALKEPIDNIFCNKNKMYKKKHERCSSPLESSGSASDSNGNTINNINLANWCEKTPWIPDDNKNLLVLQSGRKEERCNRETRNQETYTDPYDFNVAYVGGIEGYRVIEARDDDVIERNRRQHAKSLNQQAERAPLPRKLMLHKGSMTNSTRVFHEESHVDPEIPSDLDRTNELVDRYDILPRDYVLDIYKNLCKGDFDWTVDYLNSLLQEDEIYDMLEKINSDAEQMTMRAYDCDSGTEPITGTSTKNRTGSSETSSPGPLPRVSDSDSPIRKSRNRRDRLKTPCSTDTLKLKRELEEKFVLSEESYHPHILRVKRWKVRDFSPKRDNQAENKEDPVQFEDMATEEETASANISTPMRPDQEINKEKKDSPEEDISLEDNDETIELKLGYEFIKVLENEFGDSNFEIPNYLFPVIQVRKSLARELYSLWVESIQQQLWYLQHKLLDTMTNTNSQLTISLDLCRKEEINIRSTLNVPTFKRVAEIEWSLNEYKSLNFPRRDYTEDERVVIEHVLIDAFPQEDHEMVLEIYKNCNKNLEATLKAIEERNAADNTLTVSEFMQEYLSLMTELAKEKKYYGIQIPKRVDTELYYDKFGGIALRRRMHLKGRNVKQISYDDALVTAHHMRNDALRELDSGRQCFDDSNIYFNNEQLEQAFIYSSAARHHLQKAESINLRAIRTFVAAQFHVLQSDNTVDLHFLFVREALQVCNCFIDYHVQRTSPKTKKQIYVITGKGTHSVDGLSKIKPAVEAELNKRNLKYFEVNEGMTGIILGKRK